MNNGSIVKRDKYGFEIGTGRNKVAILLDKGLTAVQIMAKGFTKQTVYATRHAIKVAKGEPLDLRFAKNKPNPAPSPVVQFHPETKAFRVKAMIDAGKTDEEILAAGFTKGDIYSCRHQIKKKIEAGVPGKALVAVDEAVASVKADSKRRLAAILEANTATPRKRKANGHANGHAMAAFNPNGEFTVPVVEAILHTPGGETVRVFASPDVFPQVYIRAAKVTGFI